MQLPADDEIIMVAGAPPIRAKKARYFEDKRFLARILAAPTRTPAKDQQELKNEWDNCLVAHPEAEPSLHEKHGQESDSSGIRRDKSARNHEKINPQQKTPTPQQELSFATVRASIASQVIRPDRLHQKDAPRQLSLDPDNTLEM